mmetsp:Transcript_60785/g.100969  ORF Transcript_60785/g.100969 Transcript_60785/m.100969 type:complete len:214 (-) Transcript_60785:323-964(-)
MGLKDDIGETGIGGGIIWAKGPALTYVSPFEAAITPAIQACMDVDYDKLVEAIEANPVELEQRDLSNSTPLHYAARSGTIKPGDKPIDKRVELAKYLISKGAQIDVKDMHGDTPLTLASMSEPAGSNKSVGMCKILLDAGADMTIVENNFFMSPLHWAANGGKLEILKELLKSKQAKECMTMKDKNGCTPLELAEKAKYNGKEAAAILTKPPK